MRIVSTPSSANFHFHVVVLDGVFSEDDGGAVTFHEATHLSDDDVHRLERTLQRRVLRLFQRRGLLDDHIVADMLTWQASGGFSLDASVRIHGSDSAGRERLLRYCARPPCPDCGADMRILAFVSADEPVDTILRHLGLPATPPPLSPARGPPQHDLAFDADPGFDFDQTPPYDPTEPEPVPDFD